jgi:hypothetical protein
MHHRRRWTVIALGIAGFDFWQRGTLVAHLSVFRVCYLDDLYELEYFRPRCFPNLILNLSSQSDYCAACSSC